MPKPDLRVRGFPPFLSFGGATNLQPSNQSEFVQARASAVFKYAGVDGAGDTSGYIDQDSSTAGTVRLARNVEKELKDGHPVLPVIISFTAYLSEGDAHNKLQDIAALAHGFGNLILSLQVAAEGHDEEHPVPAAYVVNPDFLSACQAENLGPDYALPVRQPLQEALDFRSVWAEIPHAITDDLRGYVLAVNWLLRTVAPSVSFGWSVTPQATGSAAWVYDADAKAPTEVASQVVNYIKSLGVFSASYQPDFLALDRYEADDFTIRAYMNGYCYGPREWGRFIDFADTLGTDLSVPVMLWAITASRTPFTNDDVYDEFDSQHWGTGGSYIFGDSNIGSDYRNINPRILMLEPSPVIGKRVEDTFRRAEPFDLSQPAYKEFVKRGIFAVLLGGGSTTGIVSGVGQPGPWVRDKLKTYSENRIQLN